MERGSGASQTAQLTASYRAQFAELCRDPWAAALAGEAGRALSREYDQLNAHAGLYIAVRTAFIDAEVRAALTRGTDQVVILGAGLDTRAARLARHALRFFEVDHPATQAEKQRRLAALPDYPRDAAIHVPCVLGEEDFLDRLVAGGFDAGRRALIVWEGVTFYLTEAAVRATLRRVAAGCHPRSAIVFDYVERKLVEGRSSRAVDKAVLEHLAGLGEPFRWGADDVLPLLFQEGFRHVRTASFDEACLTHTGTYERERAFRFQHMALASPAPPEESA